jgi:hypothetical protein
MSIPNALSITLITKIPGFQKVKYKPTMTNPKEKGNVVYFDPLVKLNKAVAKNVPKEIVSTQFFNKGLFDTLLNRTLSTFGHSQPKRTLKDATDKGIVDNNISVTLETLFRPNTIIYFDKKPYTIYSTKFDNGNWKIDAKTPDELEIVQNNIYAHQFAENSYREAQLELHKLPQDVILGPHAKTATIVNPTTNVANNITKQGSTTSPVTPVSPIQKPPLPALPPIPPPSPSPLVPIPPPKPVKPLLPPSSIVLPLPNLQEPESFQVIRSDPVLSSELRKYFLIYYTMLNVLYQYSNDTIKSYIRPLSKGTKKHPTSLYVNLNGYNKNLVNNLNVIPIPGDGNCFFTCISYAINYYNENITSSETPINYSINGTNYGKNGKPFSQEVLRYMVVEYYNENPNDFLEKIDFIKEICDNLNEEYDNIVKSTPIDGARHRELVDNIWAKSPTKFLLKRDLDLKGGRSGEQYPFSIITDPKEIVDYLMSSNYYGADETFPIIQNKLRLKIIVIGRTDGNIPGMSQPVHKMVMPFPNIKKQDGLNWDKYLFIYNNQHSQHYDLITFNNEKNKKQIIFKKTIPLDTPLYDINVIPPIYIIFFVFGSFYYSLSDEDKKDVVLFRPQLDFYNRLIDTEEIKKNIPFTSDFRNVFSNRILGGTPAVTAYPVAPSAPPLSSIRSYPVSPVYYPPPSSHPPNVSTAHLHPSKLSYTISVELNLFPGKEIPYLKYPVLACDGRLDNIKKAWADLTGTIYAPKPLNIYNIPKNKTKKNNTSQYNSKYNPQYDNYTRKNY